MLLILLYTQPAELHFGDLRNLASAGVQLGDPLGPLAVHQKPTEPR